MSSKTSYYKFKLPETCIDFASEEGKQIFKEAFESGYMDAYFHIGQQLRTQNDPTICGLTSIVMVLNAFGIDPGFVWKGHYRWYFEDMLDCCYSYKHVQENGISVGQLAYVAKCYQLKTKLVYADEDSKIETFREEVMEMCRSNNETAIVCSFARTGLGQPGRGHFSPIGGYHLERDLALILDVSRYKYPLYWTKLEHLWNGMKAWDLDANKSRGYMILRRAKPFSTFMFQIPKACRLLKFLKQFVTSLKENDGKTWQCILKETVIDQGFEIPFEVKYNKEEQKNIKLLMKPIERTNIYKILKQEMERCEKNTDNNHINRTFINEISLEVLHYLTVFLLSLPTSSSSLFSNPYFQIKQIDLQNSQLLALLVSIQEDKNMIRTKYNATSSSSSKNKVLCYQVLLKEIQILENVIVETLM